MSVLIIENAGPATSVQDGGRYGAQRYGLPPSGAMDRLSLAAANSLVGNTPFAGAIEIGPLGLAFRFQDGPARIAVAGALRTITINGKIAPMCETVMIADGEAVKIGPARDGVFSYLAMEGGIVGETEFGSVSVNARAGLGSPYPRVLSSQDQLHVGTAQPAAYERCLDIPLLSNEPIRVVLGPQDDEFGSSVELFLRSQWQVSAMSDRMGYRLDGPRITHAHGHNIVSDGTVNGSIQVPGSGQPIILMPDRGTTGGYPKIATVISADLGRLAQMQAGRTIRFAAVCVKSAQTELLKMQTILRALPSRIRPAGSSYLNIDELQKANVAGVAVDAMRTDT